MNDIIVQDNFFDLLTINKLFDQCQKLTNGKEFIDRQGIFKGSTIAWQYPLIDLSIKELDYVLHKTLELFENTAKLTQVNYIQLHLPWDVHCDLKRRNNSTKNVDDVEVNPFYNVLVPLKDVNSRTIVFDQRSPGYNDFWQYKEENPQHPNPVSQEIWDRYLSMCWPHDRLWLSLKEILPAQQAGQIVAIKRDLFHCSDSFHLYNSGPKHYLQIILDRKT